MSELVCLQCGKEMEYDWAPCPHCGWKVPGPWDTSEEEEPLTSRPLMTKSRPWIEWTAWVLLIAALISLVVWLLRLRP